MPTQFDVAGARQAGYSDDEILSHLSQSGKFDVDGAVKAGYAPSDILNHVAVKGAVTNVPRPAPPAELTPPSFLDRVTDRVKNNISYLPRLLDTASDEAKGNPHGTASYDFDLSTPKGKAAGKTDLEAEAAAARHSAGVDQPPSPLGRVGQVAGAMATYGPRTAIDTAKQYFKDPSALLGDIATVGLTHAASGGEMPKPGKGGRTAPAPPSPEPAPALEPEQQAKYTAALDKANADYANQVGQQRRMEIEKAQPQLAEQIRTKAQAIRQTERANLDQRWADMRTRVGTETPIPTANIESAMQDAIKEDLRGAPGSVKQFKQLMSELMGENSDEPQTLTDTRGGLQPKPGNASPWQTIRTHSIAIGDALSAGNLPANIYRALKRVHAATEDALGAAPGAGEDYKALKADERKFRADFEDTGPIATGEGNPAARLVRAPNAAYAMPQILGKAGDLLQSTLAKWDPTGELAESVKQMRDMAAEAKKLPKAKVALSQAGEPQAPQTPQLAPVERPEPAPAKAGPFARATARVTGKIAGGFIGGKLGHPLLGYGVGGEVGSQLADQLAARKQPPPPPKP